MSLINDALKKAQRQRTEGSLPSTEVSPADSGTQPLQRVARRETPAGFRSQLMLIAGGVVAAVVLLAGGAVFYFRSSDQPAEKSKPTPLAAPTAAVATAPKAQPPALAAPTPAGPVAPAAIVTLPSAAPASTSIPTGTTIAAPAPSPEPAAGSTSAAPAASPAQFVIPTPAPAVAGPVATLPTNASAAMPGEHPKPAARMIAVIEHFRVGGIRVSGTESKVLMNDHVFRLNDTVDHELEIRLTGIEPKALTFEDAHGAVYTRNF